jgi:hypothetical protein
MCLGQFKLERSMTMQKQQLTLEQARENCGYSIEQVSQITGIPADTIKQCEANGIKAEAFHVHVLLALYKVDLSHINLNSTHTDEVIITNLNLAFTCAKHRRELELKYFSDGVSVTDSHLLNEVEQLLNQSYLAGAASESDSYPWSNQSAFGYMILVAEQVGLSEGETQRLVRAMHTLFDQVTLGEAAQHYCKSSY